MNAPLEPEKHRALRRRLDLLRAEHCALDEEIRALEGAPGADQLGVRRLKKRKLELRDEIERIKSNLIPNLNA
jgi:hypothetical protein